MTNWIPVDDELPPLDTTVVLLDRHGPLLGGRSDPGEGWLWCVIHDVPYYDGGWTCTDSEADPDIHPTHWALLPEPPERSAR